MTQVAQKVRKDLKKSTTGRGAKSAELSARESKRQWTLEQARKQFSTLKPFFDTEEEGWKQAGRGARVEYITVTGDGNVMTVEDAEGATVKSYDGESDFQKRIFNTDHRSISGVRNPITKAHLHAGIEAEQDGDTQLASNHFNEWLNGCTFSFSLPTNHKLEGKIQNGDQVKGNLEIIEGKRGKLVTLRNSTIAVHPAHAPAQAKDMSVDELLIMFRMKDED